MSVLDLTTALLLIDVQDGLNEPRLGQRNNPDAERNMARLLADWRAKGRPIFYVQHMSTEPNSPLRPELPGNAIKRIVAPQGDEPVIQKRVSNGFVGTDLETRLRGAGIKTVVVVGLTTEHCVSSTARMASDLGFTTLVVADATACHDRTGFDGVYTPAEDIHRLALVALQGEFATIVTTGELVGV
ncbi:MAG: cysteine hydrolase [Chloroflexi bacterium]|nr:cysteine hydrolase [Chloroflexota bacterium]